MTNKDSPEITIKLNRYIDALLGARDWCAPDEYHCSMIQSHPEHGRYCVVNHTTYHHEPSSVAILWRKDSWEASYAEFKKRKVEAEVRHAYFDAHEELVALVTKRTRDACLGSMPDDVLESMSVGFIRAANFEAIEVFARACGVVVEVRDLYEDLEAMNKLKTAK